MNRRSRLRKAIARSGSKKITAATITAMVGFLYLSGLRLGPVLVSLMAVVVVFVVAVLFASEALVRWAKGDDDE